MPDLQQSAPPALPPAFTWVPAPWGALLQCRPLEPVVGAHGWTTRQLALEGDPAKWNGRWEQLVNAGGVPRTAIAGLRQVHGSSVIETSELVVPSGPVEGDGLVSDDPSRLLTVRVADCVPLLIADSRLGAVAAVHAGWRGTARGIAAAAVRQLARSWGSSPADLLAAIGPSIGPCCYEVGADLVDAFRRNGHSEGDVNRWFLRGSEGGSLRLNLWAANGDQLVAAGVPRGSVFVSGLCTACQPEWFYSYRREGSAAGRLVAFIRAAARAVDRCRR